MFINLPHDIIYYILQKLYNYEIFQLNSTCKLLHELITDRKFTDYIIYRAHPIVFDSWDLYCQKCNLQYRINNKIESIWCRH